MTEKKKRKTKTWKQMVCPMNAQDAQSTCYGFGSSGTPAMAEKNHRSPLAVKL